MDLPLLVHHVKHQSLDGLCAIFVSSLKPMDQIEPVALMQVNKATGLPCLASFQQGILFIFLVQRNHVRRANVNHVLPANALSNLDIELLLATWRHPRWLRWLFLLFGCETLQRDCQNNRELQLYIPERKSVAVTFVSNVHGMDPSTYVYMSIIKSHCLKNP